VNKYQTIPKDISLTQEPNQGGNESDIIEGSIFADNIDGENGDDSDLYFNSWRPKTLMC
jgi:hypothetical protein